MSDVIDDDDTDALAAEFVLGTLDADERTHANLLLDIDDDFRRKVRSWERRLGELHLMVEPVEPPPQIRERIKAKLEGTPGRPASPPSPETEPLKQEQDQQEPAPAPQPAADTGEQQQDQDHALAPDHDPAAEGTPVETTLDALEAELRKVGLADADQDAADADASEGPPALFPDRAHAVEHTSDDADDRKPDVIARNRRAAVEHTRPYFAPEEDDLRPALRRWRAVAVIMMVLIVAVGGLLAAWRYAPNRLPSQLSVHSVLNVPLPPPPPPPKPKAPPESQFDE